MVLVLAQTAVALPELELLITKEKHCLLLTYMHSELAYIHKQALALFRRLDNPYVLEFEIKHKVIIDMLTKPPLCRITAKNLMATYLVIFKTLLMGITVKGMDRLAIGKAIIACKS